MVLTLVLLTLCVGFGVSFIFRDEVSIFCIFPVYKVSSLIRGPTHKGAASHFAEITSETD